MQGAGREAIVTLWRVSRNAADAAKSARPEDEVRQMFSIFLRVQNVINQNRFKSNATI
jgi:hypothetical protein